MNTEAYATWKKIHLRENTFHDTFFGLMRHMDKTDNRFVKLLNPVSSLKLTSIYLIYMYNVYYMYSQTCEQRSAKRERQILVIIDKWSLFRGFFVLFNQSKGYQECSLYLQDGLLFFCWFLCHINTVTMATFKHNWWKETSGTLECIILGTYRMVFFGRWSLTQVWLFSPSLFYLSNPMLEHKVIFLCHQYRACGQPVHIHAVWSGSELTNFLFLILISPNLIT